MKDDSIEGIYDTLKQCALISKSAGGIGVAVSCIRATGSYIAGVSFCCTSKNVYVGERDSSPLATKLMIERAYAGWPLGNLGLC